MRHEKGLIEAMWNVSLEKMYRVLHLVYKWDKLHFSRAVTADVCQTFYAVNVIKELGLCGIYIVNRVILMFILENTVTLDA